jgi:hypothetical protein
MWILCCRSQNHSNNTRGDSVTLGEHCQFFSSASGNHTHLTMDHTHEGADDTSVHDHDKQCMDQAQSWYEDGNACFKENRCDDAVRAYSSAINAVAGTDNRRFPVGRILSIKCLLNRSQCWLRLREYEQVIQDCSVVINILRSGDVDDVNSLVKALIRRSSAHEYLGDVKKAFMDAEQVLAINDTCVREDQTVQVHSTYLSTAVKTYHRLQHLCQVDKQVMNAEGTPTGMITKEQAIRLFFMEELPRHVRAGEWFHGRVCVGNEFGLWDRKHMQSCNESLSAASGDDSISIVAEIVPVSLSSSSSSSRLRLRCCEDVDRSTCPPKFNTDGKVFVFAFIQLNGNDVLMFRLLSCYGLTLMA